MKKKMLCVLAAVLLLTGCSAGKNISADDVLCPYSIKHKGESVRIELQDGQVTDAVWQVAVIPENICTLTQEKSRRDLTQVYRLDGVEEGFAQLVFEAAAEEFPQTARFRLSVTVSVDADGGVSLHSATHREAVSAAAEAAGAAYKWEVDLQGKLTFRLLDGEDSWALSADGGDICSVSDLTGTPSGWKFEAEALSPGQVDAVLVNGTSGARIAVQLQVDEAGEITVLGVQG